MFSGAKLFQLKDRHGFPIDMAISKCVSDGIPIDWLGYIKEAKSVGRTNRWVRRSIAEALLESTLTPPIKVEIENKFNALLDKIEELDGTSTRSRQ